MTVLDTLARQAGRLANDVQASLRRARLEGERRILSRQHRTALEELGERAYELHQGGGLTSDALAPQIAAVDAKLMEIEAKAAEIDALRDDEGHDAPDAAATAFPMVEDAPAPGAEGNGDGGSAGPGWERANRFFRR